ncbi:MAG: DNA-deoxyinosine glycosylase [Candidatus Woesebacteria bacterium]
MNDNSIESHPFGNFVPPEAKFLIIGSFPGKSEPGNDWFYSSKRNQFWSIFENIYNVKLKTKKEKQKLFSDLSIALTDIIIKCQRNNNSNLDTNLSNIVYNIKGIEKIIGTNNIEKIFFTSRFVENKFKQLFSELIENNPEIDFVYLPSPSPRHAGKSFEEKLKRYKDALADI